MTISRRRSLSGARKAPDFKASETQLIHGVCSRDGWSEHPYVKAELSMGFTLRVMGERFPNSSGRRMAASPDGGELLSYPFLSQLCHPPAEGLWARLWPTGHPLAGLVLSGQEKGGEGEWTFFGHLLCARRYTDAFFEILIVILSCHRCTSFFMLILQMRKLRLMEVMGPWLGMGKEGCETYSQTLAI